MNIRQLEIFLTVCETASVTEAARRLYLSQPAISKTIRELEADIGVLFFDRLGGKLYLNEEGKTFRIKAGQLLKDFDALKGFSECREVPLRIGTSLTIAMNSLPYAVTQFKTKYPETPLKIYAENVRQVQRRLLNGEIDIAFTEGFESNQGFDAEPLSEYSLLLVCAAGSAFAAGGKINRGDLLKLPFLLRERGSTLRNYFDELTHKLNVDVSPVLESINTEVLIEAAKAGLGITVLPEPLAMRYLKENVLKCLHVENYKMSTVNYAVALKGKARNKRHQDMIGYFKKAETRSESFVAESARL